VVPGEATETQSQTGREGSKRAPTKRAARGPNKKGSQKSDLPVHLVCRRGGDGERPNLAKQSKKSTNKTIEKHSKTNKTQN
jgi:hypothetical protein